MINITPVATKGGVTREDLIFRLVKITHRDLEYMITKVDTEKDTVFLWPIPSELAKSEPLLYCYIHANMARLVPMEQVLTDPEYILSLIKE